ncbi:MAG: hypothetical protein ACREM8_07340 [Vulcanimicrobiaceae bacterium]
MAITNNFVGHYPKIDVYASDLTINNPVAATFDPSNVLPAAGAIFAGDLVYITANGKVASLSTAGTSNANAASLCGVSADQYPLGIGGGATEAYADGVARVQVYKDGYFRFHTTAADALKAGQKVYLGANGQTVAAAVLGAAVGIVAGDQRPVGGALGGSIAGAAGQDIIVRITVAE